MPKQAPASASRPDRLIRLGGGLLAAGMLATAVAFTPILTNASLSPVWWLLPMAGCGAGLVTLLLGARAQARYRTRAVAAAGLRPDRSIVQERMDV